MIEEILGVGGMGEVYRATHEVLKRTVALKVLPRRLSDDPGAVARFRRGIELQARMGAHPNLVAALHAGTHEGRLYLVMEYAPGEDLAKLVRRQGPLPPERACDYVRQAARGLDHAHRHGIIHRDVKPSNLLATPDGTVKVLDLGLARAAAPGAAPGEGGVTAPDVLLGTPDYLAPEQARDPTAVDARSDLYSLGCTLYFLLTGRAPFPDRSPMDKVVAHVTEPPEPLRRLRPEVPEAVAAVADRLLAKRPEERYPSARDLAEALDRALGDPAAATTVDRPAPPRPVRRKRWLMIAGGGVILAVAAAAVALALVRDPSDRPDHRGPAPTGERQPLAPPVVRKLEVRHLAREGDFDRPRGVMGERTFSARRGDGVTVRAELSAPAYCYLIAFRPDGKEELCFPEDEKSPPLRTVAPRYPWKKTGVSYGLDEGPGLMAFVLVVSRRPLPAYAAWRQPLGASPWEKAEAQPEVVWRYDGRQLRSATPDDPAGTRSKGRRLRGAGRLGALIDWLRQAPEVETVAAVAFPVLPAQPE